jgi:hypothetical protein
VIKYDNETRLKEKLANRQVKHSLADVLKLARMLADEKERNNPPFNRYGKPTSVFAKELRSMQYINSLNANPSKLF